MWPISDSSVGYRLSMATKNVATTMFFVTLETERYLNAAINLEHKVNPNVRFIRNFCETRPPIAIW